MSYNDSFIAEQPPMKRMSTRTVWLIGGVVLTLIALPGLPVAAHAINPH